MVHKSKAMIKRITVIALLPLILACNWSFTKSNSREHFSVENDSLKISGIKCLHMFTKESKDSVTKFTNSEINTDFVFESKKSRLIRYMKFQNSEKIRDSIKFSEHQLTKRDLREHLPDRILNFELNGVYMNANVNEDDINIFCFYVDPKSKDLLQIRHSFYIGNVQSMYVFTHDVKTEYFKENTKLFNEILRLGKPAVKTDTIHIDLGNNMR